MCPFFGPSCRPTKALPPGPLNFGGGGGGGQQWQKSAVTGSFVQMCICTPPAPQTMNQSILAVPHTEENKVERGRGGGGVDIFPIIVLACEIQLFLDWGGTWRQKGTVTAPVSTTFMILDGRGESFGGARRRKQKTIQAAPNAATMTDCKSAINTPLCKSDGFTTLHVTQQY